MLGTAVLDLVRVLRSRTTWVLLALALLVLAFQTFKVARSSSVAVNPSSLDVAGFVAFLPESAPTASVPADVLASQASPTVRLMMSFWDLDYVALAAMVVFGGFFAQDVHSGYDLVRRSRGLSARRLFGANVLTTVAVSFLFATVGVTFSWAVCLAVNPRSVNAFTEGQTVLQQVFFLPQLAAAHPLLYVGLIVVLYTGILTFLGLVGQAVAALSRNVLVAAVAPAALVFVLGGYAAARLPWPFWAFDFQNLSFTKRSITDPLYVIPYVGGYFLWITAFVALGCFSHRLVPALRKVLPWPNR